MANAYSGTGGAGSNCFNLTAGAGTVAGSTTLTGAPCITLVAGTNITLTGASPNQITIASGGGGGGTVTSVAAAGTVNGITLIAAPAPITGAGTITLGGTLAIENGDWVGTDLAIVNGGTGQSTAQLAINSLSDVVAATDEFVLTKDTGTGNATWKVAGGGTISGTIADTQVAFGTGGDTIGGEAAFTYDSATNALSVSGNIIVGDGTDIDMGVLFNSDTTDYYLGRDAGTDSFMWGTGTTIGDNSFLTATTAGALTMGTSTTTSVGNVSITSGATGGVSVGGTGAISTTNGSITAGGATGNVTADATVLGVTVTASSILESQGGIQRAGVASLVGDDAGLTDFATLGGAGSAVDVSVIQLTGDPGKGVSINDPNGTFQPGAMWTITGMGNGLIVWFVSSTGAPYDVPANGNIDFVTLNSPGDAVTFFTPEGVSWNILSTAFTAQAT